MQINSKQLEDVQAKIMQLKDTDQDKMKDDSVIYGNTEINDKDLEEVQAEKMEISLRTLAWPFGKPWLPQL